MMTALQIKKAIAQLVAEQAEMDGEEWSEDEVWGEWTVYSLDERSLLTVNSQGEVMAYRLDWNGGTWYDPEEISRHQLQKDTEAELKGGK